MNGRVPPRRPTSSPARDRRPIIIGGVVVAAVVAWLLWPSGLSNVKNRDSRGTAVIAFGDSLTAGVGAAPGDDYPAKLAVSSGVPVINAGVSGDTTESALARIDQDVLSRNPRIVIVGLGGNDFLRRVDIARTEANLRTIVQKIQGAGAMVVLLGFRFPSFGPSYESMYERVAEEEGCLLVPDMMDGILSNPAMRSDDIHPNGNGYALMAERVSGPLKRLL